MERLGHRVTIHAGEASDHGKDLAASRGVRLKVGDLAALNGVDAVLAQDAESAYLLAGRRPGLRQVFATHGFSASEQPPGQLDPPPPVVVLNDRVARRIAALGSRPDVVRLRQPIDIERFRPRGAARRRARRVLLVSNYLNGAPLRMLENVCGDLGLELVKLGASGTPTLKPQGEMADADIVVGYGRSVLEAMALGRAAYVWDHAGGDGWVTPETYPTLEADGFSGAATDPVIDADRMRADFASYGPELGAFGFDLVRKHHSAYDHAELLVKLLDDASVSTASDDVLETVARLVRLEARSRDPRLPTRSRNRADVGRGAGCAGPSRRRGVEGPRDRGVQVLEVRGPAPAPGGEHPASAVKPQTRPDWNRIFDFGAPMKKLSVTSLVLVLLALVAGCGSSESDSTGSTGATASNCEPGELATKTEGKLTVATDKPAYPPYFEDDDPTNGEGFESAVAYAIAANLGFSKADVDWTVVPFNSSYAPGPKNFDFDVNQISITPTREKAVDFSAPYYTANQAVVALKDSDAARRPRSQTSKATKSASRSAPPASTASKKRSNRRKAEGLQQLQRRRHRAQERTGRRGRRRPPDRVLPDRGAGSGREGGRPVQRPRRRPVGRPAGKGIGADSCITQAVEELKESGN